MTSTHRRAATLLIALLVAGGCARSGGPLVPTARQSACDERDPIAAGQTTRGIESGGVARTYELFVPAGYDEAKPLAVVFNFHGYGSSAKQQIAYGDFRPLADRDGFVIVAPDGQGQPRHFNLTVTPAPGDTDDVAFTLDLVDEVARLVCVDRARLYATGMSNGGAMTSILACRAADTFAAFGAVAAVVWAPRCESTRVLPIAAFMGTEDAVVPFNGGTVNCCGQPQIPAAGETMINWARHNGCGLEPAIERRTPEVEVRSWSSCGPDGAVEFYVIHGGGHTWPGSAPAEGRLGQTTTDIKASEELWAFFQAHTLPSAPTD